VRGSAQDLRPGATPLTPSCSTHFLSLTSKYKAMTEPEDLDEDLFADL
jgi:hypothetical protein